jgi:hypothetical protein
MYGAKVLAGTALALLLTAVAGEEAAAQARVEVGVLTCKGRGGSGFIVVSTKHFRCRFHRPGPDAADEFYRASVSKFGLDIGSTAVTSMTWAVLAPTARLRPRSLSGNYGGVGAEATLGVGVGANALIGGSVAGIILQPLSVQAQQGLNVAAGIQALQLRALE